MARKTTKSTGTTGTKTSRAAVPKPEKTTSFTATADQPKGEEAQDAAPSLGKRDLIDRVVLASGIKKKAAKPVVEAMLKELGDAVSRGETLNLQPFGKANVKRRKDLEHAEIIEMRLRRSKLAIKAAEAAAEPDAPVTPLDPLAEAAE